MSTARGSVIRRGDRWTVVLDLGRDDNGRRIRKWHAGYRTEDEAERARTSLLKSLDDQVYVAPSRVTVRAFAEDRWLPSLDALVASGRLKPATVNQYKNLTNAYVLPKIGGVVLEKLTPDALTRAYGELLRSGRRRVKAGTGKKGEKVETGLSTTTVRAVHITIHRMLKDAQRWGLVARNVADVASADAPRGAKRDMTDRVWSPQQLGAFIASQSTDRLAALWVVAATTGMRRGELAGLRWSALDLDAGRLTVSRSRVVVNHAVLDSSPKTERSCRTVALDPATVTTLKSHWAKQAAERLAWGPEYRATDLVFVWENGRPLHPDLISRTFKRLATKEGLPVITVHGLRHSYASAGLEAGIPLKVMSDRLGHSSIAITADLYTHVRPEVDQAAADQVAALILGGEA
jgi:integrase